MKNLALLLVSSFFFLSIAPPPTELSKEELTKLYKDYYLSSKIDSITWNGSIKNCKMGSLSDEVLLKAEKRINFFRLVNRLPQITFNKEYHKYPQAAALMMHVNNELNHYPPATWKCYSQDGSDGASKSCLGYNDFKFYPEISFISGFMNDLGDVNYFCGHRRWILYSKAKEMAYGATNKAEALYILNSYQEQEQLKDVEFIAYPWNGYVPHHLIYPKWSFAIPQGNEVDFSKAKVTIKDNQNKPMAFTMFKEKKDFLDPAITWKMTSLFTSQEEAYAKNNLEQKGFIGKEINVTIENVLVNGKKRTYKYKVKIVKM